MVMDTEDQSQNIRLQLTKSFKSASDMDIQNKEVASLMGVVNEENPNVLSGGLISKLGLTDTKLFHIKKKKQDKDFRDWLLRETIQRSLKLINEIIDNLQKRIEELLERMAETEKELDELGKQQEILEAEIEFFQENGLFDCDKDGHLKNPDAEAILSGWEQKTGQKIDRTDPASYAMVLQVLADNEQREITLREKLKKYTAEYEARQKQLDEAQQIREGLLSDDEDRCQKALLAFDGFMDTYNKEFDYNEPVASAIPFEGIIGTGKISDGPTELLADGSSFGFPPIQEDFTDAVAMDGIETGENRINHHSEKIPTPMAKPTN